MPTYEFACPNGHRFDRFFRKISDSVPTLPCTECEAEAVRQLSGGAGLIFKGSGFYITDYGKDGKKSQAAPSAAGSGDKGGASDKGSASEKGDSGGGRGDGGGAAPDKSGSKPAAGGTGSTTGSSKPE